VETFDDGAVVRLVNALAIACEALVGNRSERLALALAAPLIEGGHPLASRLGLDHPAMLNVRRSYAHAQLQLGHPRAVRLLHELHQDETRLFGYDDPRTFCTLQLYWWAVASAGRPDEAETGLLALERRIMRLPNPDLPLLRHVQCKRSWIQGELGMKRDALNGYRQVTMGRSGELGISHGDTLDTRHSVGKMLVRCGDAARASETLRSVFIERRRLQGRHHPDTVETKKYLSLASGLAQPASSAFARWRLRRMLTGILIEQVRVRGADHPDTRDTEHWLTVLADLGEKS
jgi:hypothetical protein